MFSQWKMFFLFLLLVALVSLAKVSAVNYPLLRLTSPSPFSPTELDVIKQYLFANITTDEHVIVKDDHGQFIRSIPGAVLASPTNHSQAFNQDYQFHWVRDAALTMSEIVYLYSQASHEEKQRLKAFLFNYINFERKAQQQKSRPGEHTLGQPKYNIDGTIWEGEWGRPQNDGPGLRAMVMTAIANIFLQEGNEKYVRDVLMDMIKTDLEYVASEWRHHNIDLWEEVKDQDLFFTKMVQRKGLINGADFFRRMGDHQRADGYLSAAKQITDSLQRHWNAERGYLTETVHQQYFKGGGINTAIILGVLHGNIENPEDPFAVNNERVMSTIYFIRNSFSGLYRINIDNPLNPPMVGRYPNDVYDGDQNHYGNPWVLTTNALAQYYYALANVYLSQGKIAITKGNILFFQQLDAQLASKEEMILLSTNPGKFYSIINALVTEGDKILETVKHYSVCYTNFSCLHFAEQMDRTSGAQTSAKDLTWGYVSLLTAMQARYRLQG